VVGRVVIEISELNPADGAVKLQFCHVVRDVGHYWAWSDACYIDKNNNIELQQSVNSMFIWYRHSALTVIYLSDVLHPSKSGALAMSVWNSRGWTMQEFLAPKIVLCYQKDWTLHGPVVDLGQARLPPLSLCDSMTYWKDISTTFWMRFIRRVACFIIDEKTPGTQRLL
jgi:hypothetical protein